jgi:hypothetical protein
MTDQENSLPDGALLTDGAPTTTLQPPNMPTVYVNNIGFAVGPVEVRLILGEIFPNPDGKSLTVSQKLSVVMTPEYAKAVAETLTKALANLEKQTGPFRNISAPAAKSTENP